MKKFPERNKRLHEDEEDQESMDHDDGIHSQETEEEVELNDDHQKGKQVVQSDVHHRNGDRVCEQCGKRFQNGKALGGHIKVHFNQSPLPKKNKNLFKPNNNHLSLKEAHGPVGDDHSNKISCHVCNKTFLSIKSLHGHMRLHRERDWKGVRPPGPPLPPSDESNSSAYENESEDEDDGDSSLSDHTIETNTDAANFLVNWTKIEQRRRSLLANQTELNHAENSALSNQKQRVPHYAEDQVGELAGKKAIEETPVGYKGSPSSKKIKCDIRSNKKSTMVASESTGATKPMKDIGLLDRTHKQKIPTKRHEFGSRRSDTVSDVNMDEDSGFGSKYVEDQVGELSVKKPIPKSAVGYKGKRSLKIKLKLDSKEKASMQDVDENPDQSSWKMKPKKMMMKPTSKTGTKPIKDMALHDQTLKQIARKAQEFGTKFAEKGKYHEGAEAVEHGIKQFECNICPCKFSTGQALGGHKRGHNYKGAPVEEAQGTAQVASMDLEDGEIRTDPKNFNLDLNQPPHQTDHEEIGR